MRRLRWRPGLHHREFGVKSHKFKLAKPISTSSVRKFEELWGITLPQDYRVFITRLAAGGAGPYYGLLTLDGWNFLADDPSTLSTPSPLLPEVEYSEDGDWMQLAGLDPGTNPYTGLLAIAHCGCDYWCTLVLSGPARGRVCYISEDPEAEPPYFSEDPDFISWYERWLDEIEEGRDLGYFGFGMRGTEPQLLAALESQVSHRRSEALWSLACLKALNPESLEPIAAVLKSDPAPTVRARAATALSVGYGEEASRQLVDALDDRDPRVRHAAIRGLRTLRAKGVEIPDHRLLRCLEDSDRKVVTSAVYCLLDGDPTKYEPQIRALLRREETEIRTTGAFALSKAGSEESAPALIELLGDPDERLRIQVIQTLKSLHATIAAPVLRELLENDQSDLVRTNIRRFLEDVS